MAVGTEKKRQNDLDMAKGIGIILVVMAHSTLLSENALHAIHGFHIPLFFIISGILICINSAKEQPFRQIIIRKSKKIMLPYALCSVIYIAIQGTLYYGTGQEDVRHYLSELVITAISLDGISVLWFLSALFCGELLFTWMKRKLSEPILIIASVCLAVFALLGKEAILSTVPTDTLWGLWVYGMLRNLLRSFVCLAFLMCGYEIMRLHTIRKLAEPSKGKLFISGGLCVALASILSIYNGAADLHNLVSHNIILYFLNAVLGTIGVLLICKSMAEFKWMGWLAFIGANSLIIMVTHLDFLYLYKAVELGYVFADISPRAKQYVFYLVVVVYMVFMELVTIIPVLLLRYAFERKRQKKLARHSCF